MQSKLAEGQRNNGSHTGSHVSLTIVRNEGVITQVSGAKAAADDLADRHDSRNLVAVRQNPVPLIIRLFEASQIASELHLRRWRCYPASMQLSTADDRFQELLLPTLGWLF